MTWQEKNSVIKLLREGVFVTEIASRLGLSTNTVKSFCQRNPEAAMGTALFCQECGVMVPQDPNVKEKKFCSARCRTAWWNAHMDLVDRKAYYHHTCKHCGKEFESYGTKRRIYCSRKCFAEARRGRPKSNG